ncbi:MAG TPA: NAD-dependent succinate-semialdehyde dehydrogenase [Gemmatimonadaceae bacterium]|nr:NAD-dependent succinate-semialdehyde dehydrogenase [Gemmatimonadaceae bacterium]
MAIASINPATGETLRTFDPITDQALDAAIARTASAAERWRQVPVAERAAVVGRAGDILERDKERFGRLMTLEMGKPIRAAVEEAAKCATACHYYAEHAARFVAPEVVLGDDGERGEVRYEPLGVVLAIMPWNFPFWQVVRFAAPALAAGNVGLLKHASNVPQCALALEEIFREAGAPEGCFQALLVGSDRVSRVLEDRRVAAVTLTGSTPAGSAVAQTAGRVIKKTVLELGGSDPFVVMPSADLDVAVATAVKARTINNGQSCIAAKRFIVHEAIADEFERRFAAGLDALVVGDPLDERTQIGPLATPSIRDDLERQVQESIAAGARLVTGGTRLDGPGNFYPPTLLADAPVSSPAYAEELFGPVATLWRVSSVETAIRLANDTPFGLGASAWTTDAEEAEQLAAGLAAGSVFLNGMVVSDPRFPFGGIKASGYGRELGAVGLREFVNVKTVRFQRAHAAHGHDTE